MDDIKDAESDLDKPSRSMTKALRQAKDAGGDAANQAREVLHDVSDRSSAMLEDARSHALSLAETQKRNAASHLSDVADALHHAGGQLTGEKAWIGKLINRGADEVASFADVVKSNDMRGLVGKAEDFARRQPAIFIGASLVAGFALVRFGKVAASSASSSDLPRMPGDAK